MKTNTISVISVRIRSVFIPTWGLTSRVNDGLFFFVFEKIIVCVVDSVMSYGIYQRNRNVYVKLIHHKMDFHSVYNFLYINILLQKIESDCKSCQCLDNLHFELDSVVI
jgi:hypothetical protein